MTSGRRPRPKTKRATAAAIPASQWQRVLALGEQLLLAGASPQGENKYPGPAILLEQRKLILETAASLVEGEVSLWLAEDLLPSLAGKPQTALDGLEPDFGSEPPTALMRRAWQSRALCCAPLVNPESGLLQEWPVGDGRADVCQSEDCREDGQEARLMAAPLLARDHETGRTTVLGVLQVARPEGRPFSDAEIELLHGLAVQSATALQADRQMAIERWRVEQLALVRRVSAQIITVRDLDELARRVTNLILHTFDYYYVAIFTLEPGADALNFRASAGPRRPNPRRLLEPEEEEFSPTLSVHLGEGIIGHAAQTGQEVLANDVSQAGQFRFLDALPETRSEVALPLKIEDRVLGVLDVQSDQVDDFHDIDLLVLRALAGNVAIAVEGARLYSSLRRRAEQLSSIYEVSNAITSILDTDELMGEVVNLIQKRFGYPYVHLYTVHPGRRKIFYEAGTGAHTEYYQNPDFALDLDDPRGIIPWVARQGETVLSNDVDSEPRYRPSPLPPNLTRSELTVPLIFGGQVQGVLDVQSDQLNAFSEEDRFLFEALADNVAIAMRNASLYRSERWRRQVADSLREVAGLLSTDADLDQVLDAILVEMERTLPSDLAAIWLLDEDPTESEGSPPVLRLAAVHGSNTYGLELEEGLTLEDLHALAEDDQEISSDWLIQALDAEQPVIREPATASGPLGTALGFPQDYSAIAAPLRVGDQRLGLLSLAIHTPKRYGTEAKAMTAAFASYAAVAIENTRLFESAHEQAWVSTVLLQVAEATQSIHNLNELLATVVRVTPRLVGVKACALYLLDEEASFIPAAAAGLAPEQQAEFERWRFAPGDVAALDELLENPHPTLLYGEKRASLLAEILSSASPDGQEKNAPASGELLVLVPLLARGEVLGAFLVDYSNTRPSSSLDALEALFDERLAIIQGIAHQTAIAVENIRLVKTQKEEAYVSVALLQVAQAVVSLNDLDDILGAIVRITPILVGVKRAVIYLWNSAHEAFHMSQAYGLPRYTDMPWYASGEFPILDAVRQRDSLAAYPMDASDASSEEGPELWDIFPAPDAGEMEEYLESNACLLLAFPLSVKGNVLGVLLVEEPDPAPSAALGTLGSSSDGSANRRLRAKRMEIITGISQQAALAIQNDQLQREMVNRERLEREMQLAREIQRTFLPHQLPVLPGWDLNARWRTAREVGGDFYDYFELPDNHFGLLIADVADKGMPAALFMTLVRTLVRATVQQTFGPTEVLARVNDVLVPDAEQGMFVTLLYAVLNLETGALTYASAGHNPPFLRRAGGQVERFQKGGMALGVQDGSRVEEHTTQIYPGDCLVLYTDGVTETFASNGDMFGEASLRAAIQATDGETAWDMVAAIDSAVSQFLGEALPTDDFTLLILKRKSL